VQLAMGNGGWWVANLGAGKWAGEHVLKSSAL